jgi:hypothetical protein
LLIETCEKRLVDAIAHGDNMDPLLTRLRTEGCRKKDLVAELNSHSAHVVELDKVRLKHDLRSRVADAKSLLERHTIQARQILRKLHIKPLHYEVIEENGKPSFRVTGEGSYLYLLTGIASPYVVSPTGFSKGGTDALGFRIDVRVLAA